MELKQTMNNFKRFENRDTKKGYEVNSQKGKTMNKENKRMEVRK